MKKRITTWGMCFRVLALVFANVQVAVAHNWWKWHWHKNPIHIYVWGSHQKEAVAAIADWDRHIRDLKLHTKFKGHTNISVFGWNWGNTQWGGLATITEYSYDWWHTWTWSKIEHAHATYNSYYGGNSAHIQGIFCQEIGHCFGLDHSNTGDCMGKSYFNNINVTGPHNWNDMNAKY